MCPHIRPGHHHSPDFQKVGSRQSKKNSGITTLRNFDITNHASHIKKITSSASASSLIPEAVPWLVLGFL
mgnify:CR=1 FL=1